jgi:hypothetical protein
MDPAVGLVQAYLRINGFFTVTEYPVVAGSGSGATTLTDVDILATRFPGAARWVPGAAGRGHSLPADPRLAAHDDRLHMIIGEVKEGQAKLNRAAYTLPVIETVIRRFGCCARDPAATARAVVQNGSADTYVGTGMPCRIQRVVFAGLGGEAHERYDVISLQHVVTFLNDHLAQHRDIFLHTELKDETLGLMALLAKLGIKQ